MFGYWIHKLEELTPEAEARLLTVWESSVRATHDFLTENDISAFRSQIGPALLLMDGVLIARDVSTDDIDGFLAYKGDKIEMLFICASKRGSGIGRRLVTAALEDHGIRYVDVNEQNPQGIGFYEHLGFTVKSRSETDEQGNPFPLLHMELG